ncbi:MAG: FHA domain-containing protein, partial [Planctomycetota bacterium]
MTPKLTVTAGASRGTEVELTGRIIFNIGSDRGSTVFLDDPKVSPNHCRLYNEDQKFTLFDVSGRGMDINGQRVVKAVLQEGDVVTLGDSVLAFSFRGASANQGGAPQHAPAAGFQMDLQGAERGPVAYSRVWLQCVEGNDKGKTFDLSEGTSWSLCRGHNADITVMD